MNAMKSIVLCATGLALVVAASGASAQTITVVNLIPNTNSKETNDDSEPNIAVNPANPLQMAASAFTPDSSGATNAQPIFLSQDGGVTWTESSIIPVNANNNCPATCDITLRFGGASNILYVGWLDGLLTFPSALIEYSILRTTPFPLTPSVTILENIPEAKSFRDQPYTQAVTVIGDPAGGSGNDRLYVGSNDATADPKSATIDQSMDAATAAPPAGLAAVLPEVRTNCGFDGPPVRPAIHPDGTVYAVFSSWTTCSGTSTVADVVLVRDDNWGRGSPAYSGISDSSDSKAGVKVATGISIPFNTTTGYASLGTERIGSMLSIAVDPRNSQIVYVAWGTGTKASDYKLNVARSGSGGASGSWTTLLTVSGATNPALAVTVAGTVGFLYQQLVTPGTCNAKGVAVACWETHLQTSNNFGNTWSSNFTLANLPDLQGPSPDNPSIGDYDHLLAVGKDFYGIFSGFNGYASPSTTNFPKGITFQRASDSAGNFYTDSTLKTKVVNSVDPFFFHVAEVAPGNDFYVRDWTDSATSGDNGAEPSSHPVFFATSDVWNRRGTLDGTPFPNDQPANEDAGNGSGNVGDNWAFARIRRNAIGSAATVTAHFLVSKFGTGSNFEDDSSIDPDVAIDPGDPTISFAAADLGPKITPAHHWHLSAIAGNHLCLAVEITAPNDPYLPPSLVGSAPGWTTGTDIRVVDDNNKAQRNMGLTSTPARGAGMTPTACAIVHNAAMVSRDVTLRVEASADALKTLKISTIAQDGGQKDHSFSSREPGNIVLPAMQPGENRWLCSSFAAPAGNEGAIEPISFLEMQRNVAVNGFTVGPRLVSMDQVIRANLELHRSAFTRLAEIFHMSAAREEARAAEEQLHENSFSAAQYLHFLKAHSKPIEIAIRDFLKTQHSADSFGIEVAHKALITQVDAQAAENASVVHASLMNKLDSSISMHQLAKGDPADILQMVRWQRELYATVPQLKDLHAAHFIVNESQEFIDDFSKRKRHADTYPELVRELLTSFHETAEALERIHIKLEPDIEQIKAHLTSLDGLEKAHRNYLTRLQSLAK